MKFTNNHMFSPVDRARLMHVIGGTARVTGRSSAADKDTLTALTNVTNSIKDLAANKNSSSDSMMPMMMMMMMGGGGGGGGAAPAVAPAPAPAPAAPVVRISNSIR